MQAKPPLAGAIAAIILMVSILCGCSGSNGPAAPSVENGGGGEPELSAATSDLGRDAWHYLWGYFLVLINRERNHIEIAPMRQVAGHWNVLTWLENGPCIDCLKITNLEPSGAGTVLADVQITHPFPGKLNFTGFDVRGIAMFDGSHEFPESGLTNPDGSLGDGELVNADGYTTLYNSTTMGSGPDGMQGYFKGRFATVLAPDALLNGYKRHISHDPANSRNAFYAGDSITVTYEIDMPDGPLVLGYAVDACWAPPIVKPVTDPMSDFPPEANCPEPWRISVSEAPVGDGLTDCGGLTNLIIDVYDRQGKETHAEPIVECPELFESFLMAAWLEDGSGFASYQVSVANDELAPAGEYRCLIGVEDEENDPIAKPWLDLTAYQLRPLRVVEHVDKPPTAVAEASQYTTYVGELIDFDGSGSYDNDCDGQEIVQWEWDWDGDGEYDDQGVEMSHSWPEEGSYLVQLRVTDDEGGTDELDEPLEIVVKPEGIGGWALSWTDANTVWHHEVASDGLGNVYVVGVADGACLRKVTASGEIEWTRKWAEEEFSICDGVDTDHFGNVYVIGCFVGPGDFDPGPGEDVHESNGATDIFLIKFNSSGDFRWAETWGGDLSGGPFWWERGHGVAVDHMGDVYATGLFRGLCDFDPGLGVDEHTSNGYESGGFDAFISKFYSDGEFQWARTWGAPNQGSDQGEVAFGVDTDSAGDVYVVGGFLGTVDFDPGDGVEERTSVGEYGDTYLLKWNPTGDFVWVDAWEGTGWADTSFGVFQCWGGSYVTIDNSDGIYVTGFFEGTIDFDPGPGVEELEGDGAYLSKFDPSGQFNWVDIWQVSGLAQMNGVGVKADSHDNVYVTGFIAETVDMNPGPETDERTPMGYRDAYLCKVDSFGSYLWSLTWGSTGASDMVDSWGVTTDENDNVYTCGLFQGTVDFDPGPGTDYHTSGAWGGYLVKFLPDGTW